MGSLPPASFFALFSGSHLLFFSIWQISGLIASKSQIFLNVSHKAWGSSSFLRVDALGVPCKINQCLLPDLQTGTLTPDPHVCVTRIHEYKWMYNVSPAQNNNNNKTKTQMKREESRRLTIWDIIHPSIHLLVIKFRCPRARWEGSHTGQVTHLSQV